MKIILNTKLVSANLACRAKDYQLALEIYDEIKKTATGPLLVQVENNRSYVIDKIYKNEINNNNLIENKTINIEFEESYYKSKYSDLRNQSLDLSKHYNEFGKAEGRAAIFNFNHIINKGKKDYDHTKKTLLIVCHEASRTGAPILGLRVAEALSLKYNIIIWFAKSGSIIDEFSNHAVAIIDHYPGFVELVWGIREINKKYNLICGILNSAVTSNFSSALFELKIPSVALIHEYADYMEKEIIQILATANRVVFPAEGVKKSADEIFTKYFLSLPRQSIVKNQGVCIPPMGGVGNSYTKEKILNTLGVCQSEVKPIIVMGCGWVNIRKGIEYFIHVAQICKYKSINPIKFMWIGGGFNPLTDFNYSIWLQSQLKNSDLKSDLFFFDEAKDLSPFFDLADIFFLSSRLDPFPNVAIDSVNANVPIIAFNKATGFTDFIEKHPSVGVVVPYLDIISAANSIIDLSTNKKNKPTLLEKKLIDDDLSFEKYVEFIEHECIVAINRQNIINEEVSFLEQSKLMNAGFHKSGIPNYENYKNWYHENTVDSFLTEEYVYVARWDRGIITSKSKPGFSDQIAEKILNLNSISKEKITPLARWGEFNKSFLTHDFHELKLNYKNLELETKKLRIAVHLHVFYIDGFNNLLQYFVGLINYVQIIITTTSENKSSVHKIFKKFSNNKNILLEPIYNIVPNIGRDVGPFIMTLKEYYSSYDLIGHFHVKGTKEMLVKNVYQWQKFLCETLIGQSSSAAIEIINKFENNSDLGLVFQDDPCLPSWGSNFDKACEISEELNLNNKLLNIQEYPTGNMFWVRTKALKLLLSKDWKWSDFPSEPIPYDGTMLHAIERLIPVICVASKFKWMTVRNPNSFRYEI